MFAFDFFTQFKPNISIQINEGSYISKFKVSKTFISVHLYLKNQFFYFYT